MSIRPRPLGKTGLASRSCPRDVGALGRRLRRRSTPPSRERTSRARSRWASRSSTRPTPTAAATMEARLGRMLRRRRRRRRRDEGAAPTARPTRRASASTRRTSRAASRARSSASGASGSTCSSCTTRAPTPLAVGEAVDALLELKKEGTIGHWGVAAGDVEVGRAAIDKGAEVIELAYNLHPRDRPAPPRGRRDGLRASAMLARSTLAYGLLAGMWTKDREFDGRGPPRRPLDEARARAARRTARRAPLPRAGRRRRRCARPRCASCSRTTSCRAPSSGRGGGAARAARARDRVGPALPAGRGPRRAPARALAASGFSHDAIDRAQGAGRASSAIAREAGEGIARVYAGPFDVEYKDGRAADDPVTRADREANALICAELARAFPGVPDRRRRERRRDATRASARAPAAWFVDPLDGTREFVAQERRVRGDDRARRGGARDARRPRAARRSGERSSGSKGIGAFEVAADGARTPIRRRRRGPRSTGRARRSCRARAARREAEAKIAALGLVAGAVRQLGREGGARRRAARRTSTCSPGSAGMRWDACAPEALVRAAGGQC